jgi:phosphatidylglycerophosphatase A
MTSSSVSRSPARLMRHPHGWLALGLGSGLSPIAPGTMGSLVAVLLWAPFVLLAEPGLPWRIAALALAIVLCTWSAHWASRQLQRKDPGCIVSDELAGQWLALLVVPDAWPWWLAAFALFRLFDISKLWPMRRLERLPGGIGIVADDLAAGVYAAIILLVAQYVLAS